MKAGSGDLLILMLSFFAPTAAYCDNLEEPVCSGTELRVGRARSEGNFRFRQFETFVAAFDDDYSEKEEGYAATLLGFIEDDMIAVAGPADFDTLWMYLHDGIHLIAYMGCDGENADISMWHPSSPAGIDNDRDGEIDEDPFDTIDNDGDGRIDEDPDRNVTWDRMFIHELSHAFQRDFICDVGRRSWIIEGMAEAITHFVGRRSAEHGDHVFSDGYYHVRMSDFDFDNLAGPQLLGAWRPVAGFDSRVTYAQAGGVFVIAAYADLAAAAAGETHPLARFGDALAEERHAGSARAMDRAFRIPIDGVSPASRWIRAKSISNPKPGPGDFLAIFPKGSGGRVDPVALRVVHLRRHRSHFEIPHTEPLVYTGIHGEYAGLNGSWSLHDVPELPIGAYRVRAGADAEDGRPLDAMSWIVVTGHDEEPAGTALIFVDSIGVPLDVVDFHVNGEVIDRFPGGAFVRPWAMTGELIVTIDRKPAGRFTVPGDLGRMVVVSQDGEFTSEYVRWVPYKPAAGDTMEVWLHRPSSAIAYDSGAVVAVLGDDLGGNSTRGTMEASGGLGWYTSKFPVTDPREWMDLRFYSSDYSTSSHAVEFAPGGHTPPDLLSARLAANHLELEFSTPPATIPGIRYATTAAGPWTVSAVAPAAMDGDRLLYIWPVPEVSPAPMFFEVFTSTDSTETALALIVGEASSLSVPVSVGAPHPNPAVAEIRWLIESGVSMIGSFEVFDISGRRVAGPTDVELLPGTKSIFWDCAGSAGKLPPGVYFMRFQAGVEAVSKKVILVR